MKEAKNGTSDESGTKGTALLALASRPLDDDVADLKDKLERVKRRKEDIDRYVPKEYQTDAVKAWKRKVDRLEAEVKAAEDEMKEVKDDKQNGTSDESGTKGTALLARTEPTSRQLDAEVDDLKDKLEHMKSHKEDIDRYVPKEYQTDAHKAWRRKVDRLEAEVKAAEDEMKKLK